MENIVNKEVVISSVYFSNKKQLETFPKQMEFEGQTYTFLNSGWRYLVKRGKEIIRIFEVTDGEQDFRLRLDTAEDRWTLVKIKPATLG